MPRRKNIQVKNHIRDLRETRGWSQKTLGTKLGLSAPQVNRLEKGLRRLTVEDMLILAAAFEATPDQIVDMRLAKLDAAQCDQAVLGLVVGWMIEAWHKLGAQPTPKEIGKWSAFAYQEICARDLSFKEMRKYATSIAKLADVKKMRVKV